jgi:peptidoglycan/xylan/chitin deacetylase (PgdA/CDA1 family)
LEYHLIDKLKDGKAETDGVAAMSSLVVSPETFDAQMKILHDNGWQTITMAELANYLLQGKTPPDKTFVITFDDGYEDGFINALPILQKYGYVATFYVITNRTGNASNLTSLQLYQLTQLQNDIGNHSANHTDSTTDATADNEIDSADENIAADAGAWPSTAAYPFGDRYTYEEVVARCITLVMAVIQQPNSNVPEALENKNNRLAVPRIKIWSWVNPDYLLYMLNHLNQNLADNVKLQKGIVIVFPEILDRKEDEEMAA